MSHPRRRAAGISAALTFAVTLGEESNDKLFGKEGNHLLNGQQGRDLCDGGSGDDLASRADCERVKSADEA